MRPRLFFLALLATLFPFQPGSGENWPSWRGTNGHGVAAGDDYPTQWSAEENIQWSYALPGPGSSTPAVWEDHLFVTCADGRANAVVCLNLQGQHQWTQTVGTYSKATHKKATGANPSPVTDGQHVYCYFKSGDLVCLDFTGRIVWQTNLQDRFAKDNLWWDLGTSPVLIDDLLVVACLQTGNSYVAAFRASDGELAWKVSRDLPAPKESNQSYTTPCVAQRGDQTELTIVGADHVTAHALTDGQEIWRVGGLNPAQIPIFRSISSPVCSDDMVFACYARGGTLTAIRRGGEGDVTDSHVAWKKKGAFADVPTPAFDGERLYVCADKGLVTCLIAATGEEVWKNKLKKLRGAISASPVIAGGHLYVTAEDGKTFVLDLASQGKVVATNALDELIVATPVFVNGRVILRTINRLICVGS